MAQEAEEQAEATEEVVFQSDTRPRRRKSEVCAIRIKSLAFTLH